MILKLYNMETIITNREASNSILKILIEDCKRMDQKAQFQIYKLYYKVMYNTSLGIVNDPMEAENIMQESFLVAFEQINTYSGNVTFSANLVTSATSAGAANLIIDARSIAPDETYTCPELVGQALEPSSFISTLASAATSLTIRASGREIT